MPFLRFTRDKRGYEQFALVQPVTRRGKSVTRVLYWFRTPPDVKLGREPFDEPVRRALEAQNPGVTFDWRKILETPIPSADAEKWRERRRAERAERAARQAADREDDESDGAEKEPGAPVHVIEAAAAAAAVISDAVAAVASESTSAAGAVDPRPPDADARRIAESRPRRRRRRGGRGRSSAPASPVAGGTQEERSGDAAGTQDTPPDRDE